MRYVFVFCVGMITAFIMWYVSYTLLFRDTMLVGSIYGGLGCFGLFWLEMRSKWRNKH